MISKQTRRILAPILYPVSLLYGFGVALRNRLFDWKILKSREFNFPVISVGNLTVGGTGKTPHVEYILSLLSKDFKLALLSRGYKRKTKGFVKAGKKCSPNSIGDESFQVYRKFGKDVEVAVDEKRVHGIEMLKSENPQLQAVILDDAHQHRYVKPGVNIVLIDYHRPVYEDYYLPFGTLRESMTGLHRANVVIVTKVPRDITPIEKRLWIKELKLFPYQFLFFTTFEYGELTPVYSGKKTHKLKELEDTSVLLVTGIANTIPLENRISGYCKDYTVLKYGDHKEYGEEEREEIIRKYGKLKGKKKIIITTEKDAVKLVDLNFGDKEIAKNFFYLPVKVKFLDGGEKQFNKRIADYVAKNKRISRLHK